MTNEYEQDCEICRETVIPGEGILEKDELDWKVYHPACREVVEKVAENIREYTADMSRREMKVQKREEIQEIQDRLATCEQEKCDAVNAIEDSSERLEVSNGASHPIVDEKREAYQQIQREKGIRQYAWRKVLAEA